MLLLLVVSATLFILLGKETSDKTAKRLMGSGIAQMANGNEDVAVSALREALTINPDLNEARRALAQSLLASGDTAQAQAQFRQLSEHLPRDFSVRESLTWLAMLQYDWDEAGRHGNEAIRINAASQTARAIASALALHAAQLAGDLPAIERAVAQSHLILSETPENLIARWSVIEAARSGPKPYDAIPDLDIAISLAPGLLELEMAKLSIYSRAGDSAGGGAQLRVMFGKYPDDENIRKWLFDWYLAVGDTNGALEILRFQATIAHDELAANRRVVDFVRNRIGTEAALDELRDLAKKAQGTPLADAYLADAAGITFDLGRKDEAIAMLQTIVRAAVASDQNRDITMLLVRMLEETGRTHEAKERVAGVLAEDPGQVQGLMIYASWLIKAGKADEALMGLRVALSQNANDDSVLILMAKAYRELGVTAMEGEMLRQAVTASENGVAASLLLYDFQTRTGRTETAVNVLEQSLNNHPEDPDLLAQLATDAIDRLQWQDADHYIGRLQAIAQPDVLAWAASLLRASTLKRDRAEATDLLLQATIRSLAGEPALAIQYVRSQFAQGRTADALRTLQDEVAARPNDSQLLLLQASLQALAGEKVVPDGLVQPFSNRP